MATESDKIHAEAMEAYEDGIEGAEESRREWLDDFRFGRLAEQWPEEIRKMRSMPGKERPMLTISQMAAFGRQVVNDIRQNRPQMKVRPVDSAADVQTALVIQGLLRNIEQISKASIAYDTASEHAVYGGFGFWRVDIDYCTGDSFDQDILIRRIANPLSVIPDPYSIAADSSDWEVSFVCELMSPARFKAEYPDAEPISFDAMDQHLRRHWVQGDDILVAEYWKREKARKLILRLSDGTVVDADDFARPNEEGFSDQDIAAAAGITVVGQREIDSYRVKQCVLNGQEVLSKRRVLEDGKQVTKPTYDWPGRYIPIIPVYGDEINVEGKRIFRSMIHDAKDAQRQLNYWETAATELVALAPRVPYIGPKGAFKTDKNWNTANSQNHPYLEYDGATPPARQPLDPGPAVGAMTQARAARDNMKAVLGMYDASLGARSNETSGKAIQARQREGDVSQFHFSDNLMRAIAHSGIVIMDLIPHVYSAGRIARVLGDDGAAQNVELGQRQYPEHPEQPGAEPEPPQIGALQGVFDLAMGKYDLVVEAGPSYTTQRMETAEIVGKMAQSYPAIMEIGGDILVKNLDIKDGDELARRLKKMLPPPLQDNGEPQIPPQVQQMIAEGQALIAQLQEENQKLKQDEIGKAATVMKAQTDTEKNALERDKLALERSRLPIENAQAQAALLQAQKDLEMARAQLGQTTAETNVAQGVADGLQAITQAAVSLASAAAMIAAPKTKQVQMARQGDGSYAATVTETPMVQ